MNWVRHGRHAETSNQTHLHHVSTDTLPSLHQVPHRLLVVDLLVAAWVDQVSGGGVQSSFLQQPLLDRQTQVVLSTDQLRLQKTTKFT